MKMRLWHMSDIPQDIGGIIYLHNEVEDFIGKIIDQLPEEEWTAADLANTDAAGITTFVAAFGLGNLGMADVVGCGRLAEYKHPMVFVGMAVRYPTSSSLRLRGLVVNEENKDRILIYLRSRRHTRPDGTLDLLI